MDKATCSKTTIKNGATVEVTVDTRCRWDNNLTVTAGSIGAVTERSKVEGHVKVLLIGGREAVLAESVLRVINQC